MAKGRKVKRAEAADLLCAWECSGERMSVWCAARGLNWYSLNAYKGRMAPVAGEVEFAEVVLTGTVTEPAPVARYRVELGEVVIEVDDHFRADTLRRLVEAVATC